MMTLPPCVIWQIAAEKGNTMQTVADDWNAPSAVVKDPDVEYASPNRAVLHIFRM